MNSFPPFVPHPLLRGGHLQTIAGVYLARRLPPYRAAQHVVALPDGDRIMLHDDRPEQWHPGDRVALLLHGVAGCHGSPYLVRVAEKLNRIGVRTFRMDMRGCGAARAMAEYPGHAGRSEDAAAAVAKIQQAAPGSPLTLVGFSMGGNIVLKMLGEAASHLPGNVDGAVALAPPIDLICCGKNIDRGWNRMYSRNFTRLLVQYVRERRETVPAIAARPLLPYPTSIVDFDNRFTAPLSGFRDVWDYYEQASAWPVLARVAVPTLILTAKDDPVVPFSMFERACFSSTIQLVAPDRGGHIGFVAHRNADPDRWWMDWRIIQWIQSQPARRSLEPASVA